MNFSINTEIQTSNLRWTIHKYVFVLNEKKTDYIIDPFDVYLKYMSITYGNKQQNSSKIILKEAIIFIKLYKAMFCDQCTGVCDYGPELMG